jgi:hypothetical protein
MTEPGGDADEWSALPQPCGLSTSLSFLECGISLLVPLSLERSTKYRQVAPGGCAGGGGPQREAGLVRVGPSNLDFFLIISRPPLEFVTAELISLLPIVRQLQLKGSGPG